MKSHDRVVGSNRFGGRRVKTGRARYSVWRYVVSIVVLALSCIYAAPNLYPPDYAVQIQADNSTATVDASFVDSVSVFLQGNGIAIERTETTPQGALIRFQDASTQLRAQSLIARHLNPSGLDRQFVVALNLAPNTPEWLQDLGAKPMTLGLDLAGGVHFVLEVAMDEAIAKQVRDESARATRTLRDAGIRYVGRSEDMVFGTTVRVPFKDPQVRDEALALLAESIGLPDHRLVAKEAAGLAVVEIVLQDARIREIEDITIEQNLAGMRHRVNELGVAEPLVQRLGHSRIVIDLPGVQDPTEIKRKLDKFASLDFRLGAKTGDRPSSIEVMEYQGRAQRLQRASIITGENVVYATHGRDPETGLPQVSIRLDSEGGERINRATAPNIGHPLAIIFVEQKPIVVLKQINGAQVEVTEIREERRLISVATIQVALPYNFRITGLASPREARDLAFLLRAGALAAPMYIVEERTVGASLGEENIERGVAAVSLGLILVLAFMLVYYKVFGLIANIALTANVVVLLAVMSLLGATLTLPGIAGIVLTIGMAVDANVLIFSRIREELRKSTPLAAIQAGYDRAFVTILDANITTLFVALILLTIGSGPVVGFAVTLSIGILTSMFTAIFVSRGIVELIYGHRRVEKLWI